MYLSEMSIQVWNVLIWKIYSNISWIWSRDIHLLGTRNCMLYAYVQNLNLNWLMCSCKCYFVLRFLVHQIVGSTSYSLIYLPVPGHYQHKTHNRYVSEKKFTLRYVGVIRFSVHLLQLLPVRFTQQHFMCCISKSKMKYKQKLDWKLDHPYFSYGY